MMARNEIWKRLLLETIWGNKGLSKGNKVWLPLAAYTVVKSKQGDIPDPVHVLLLFFSVAFCFLACFFINDLADEKVDLLAGRQLNAISRLPRYGSSIVIALVAVLGLCCCFAFDRRGWMVLVYLITLILGSVYSIQPFRFKEKGGWGVFIFIACVLAGSAVLPWIGIGTGYACFGLVFFVVLFDEWVKIHGHEVHDYEGDLRASSHTLAVAQGYERAKTFLQMEAYAATLVLLVLTVYTGWMMSSRALAIGGILGFAGAATWFGALVRRGNAKQSNFVHALPLFYLGLSHAVTRVLPLLVFGERALRSPSYRGVFVVAIVFIATETVNWGIIAIQENT